MGLLNAMVVWVVMLVIHIVRAMGINTAYDWFLLFLVVTGAALLFPDHKVLLYINWHIKEVVT